jgi:hypothetical protein
MIMALRALARRRQRGAPEGVPLASGCIWQLRPRPVYFIIDSATNVTSRKISGGRGSGEVKEMVHP